MKRLKIMLSLLVISFSISIISNSVQGFVRAQTVIKMVDNNIHSTIYPDYIGTTEDGKIITRITIQRLCVKCYTERSLVNEYTYYIDDKVALNDSRFTFLADQPKFSDIFKQ